jgi:hypothetical protein
MMGMVDIWDMWTCGTFGTCEASMKVGTLKKLWNI